MMRDDLIQRFCHKIHSELKPNSKWKVNKFAQVNLLWLVSWGALAFLLCDYVNCVVLGSIATAARAWERKPYQNLDLHSLSDSHSTSIFQELLIHDTFDSSLLKPTEL
jgi:hypothetical protein